MNWIDQHIILGGMPTSRADLSYLSRKHAISCVMSIQETYELPPCFSSEVQNTLERRTKRKQLQDLKRRAAAHDKDALRELDEVRRQSAFQSSGVLHDLGMVHVNRSTPDWTVIPMKSLAYCVATLMLYASYDRRVYLHCRRGQGRSGTVAVAYTCIAHGLTPEEAEAQIRAVRPSLRARTRANWRQIHDFVTHYWNSPAGYAVRKRVIDAFNSAGFTDNVQRSNSSSGSGAGNNDDMSYEPSYAASAGSGSASAADLSSYGADSDQAALLTAADHHWADSDDDEDDEIPPPPPPLPFDPRSIMFLGDDEDIPPPPPPRPGTGLGASVVPTGPPIIPPEGALSPPPPPPPLDGAAAPAFGGLFGGSSSSDSNVAAPRAERQSLLGGFFGGDNNSSDDDSAPPPPPPGAGGVTVEPAASAAAAKKPQTTSFFSSFFSASDSPPPTAPAADSSASASGEKVPFGYRPPSTAPGASPSSARNYQVCHSALITYIACFSTL